MKFILHIGLFLTVLTGFSQTEKKWMITDSINHFNLSEIVISALRVPEKIIVSPVSIEQLNFSEAKKMGSVTCFDAIENLKGVQLTVPSLGFKVISTRGFANTTNVRFTQLVDGIDNQAPHIGAPIANVLGANDLDIEKLEVIPGTASALYGTNSINGLVNVITKSPFKYEGITCQQLVGINHVGNFDDVKPKKYSITSFRYAEVINSKTAFKINGAYTDGYDWVADNKNDLAEKLNSTVGLTGANNPALDEVNSYGNESSNRRTLMLGGKNYVVARTGYRETDITDYNIQNYKADAGIYYKPKLNSEFSISYKGALVNNIYQRANRFKLQDYMLQQCALTYQSPIFQFKSYLTNENTGRSYNIRSLAENMDKAFKSDNQWFSEFSSSVNNSLAGGIAVADAMKMARNSADNGRYMPGTAEFNQKKNELIDINNWDYGAALRVKSSLAHAEGLINWDKLDSSFFDKHKLKLFSGFDCRSYIITPDGNYFINPINSSKKLFYSKWSGFIQINKNLFDDKLKISAALRADKADYFDVKMNPRFTVLFAPKQVINFRMSYQVGYRFPSVFEGFSNVNSGGVKRVGGLRIVSDGIFENSYTKASIDAFQQKVITDVNNQGLTLSQAIDVNKKMLQKNTYSYLQPEQIQSYEFGIRYFPIKQNLFLDADFYFNSYTNFIAQIEASVPNTPNSDSIAFFLNDKSKQNRYRLWTNSKSKVFNSGATFGLRYTTFNKYTYIVNFTFSKLNKKVNDDGLEDGFNTPSVITNATILIDDIWKKLGASITARYQNKYDYISFLVNGQVPSFWSIDAQLNYLFEKQGITIKLGSTNLLNKKYYTMLGGSAIGGLYYVSVIFDSKILRRNI